MADRSGTLEQWNARARCLTSEHLEIVDGIGGTGTASSENVSEYIRVPCKVTWKTGTCVDPAILLITPAPPIDEFYAHVALYEEECRIEPSQYALPLTVRMQAAESSEVGVFFAPTRIESAEGARYILNYSQSVLDFEGRKGQDMRLAREAWSLDSASLAPNERDAVTHIYCDWFAGAEGLLRSLPPRRRKSWLRRVFSARGE